MDYNQEALRVHKEHKGKIEVISKLPVTNKDELSVAYTPGVAEPCRAIHANKDDVYTYTTKGNMVAVLSDGSAVLGLGNIGAEAAIPVMEGKAVLSKRSASRRFPICVATQVVDEIVKPPTDRPRIRRLILKTSRRESSKSKKSLKNFSISRIP
jgi:malate dehydrogenase (oxaloacetate-decarboxylating)